MPLAFKARYADQSDQVLRGLRRAAWRSLARLGFLVRAAAKESLERTSGPSEPGEPPHTHTGRLPKAVLYAVDEPAQSVFIGPSANVVGNVGAAFEHPGTRRFRGQQYPSRQFMGPALGEEIGQLPGILAENFGRA